MPSSDAQQHSTLPPNATNNQEDNGIAQKIAFAKSARAKGELHEAIRCLMEVVNTAPNSGAAYAALGGTFLDAGDDVNAETALRKAVQLVPENPGVWMNLGILEHRRHRLDEANGCFVLVTTLIPTNEKPWLALLQVQKEQQNFDGALQTAGRLVALNPSTKHLVLKAETLVAANRLDDAEAVFDKLLQRRPVDPEAVEQWFNLLVKQSRHEELITRLLALSKSQPNSPILWVSLGRTYVLQWQYKKALEAYVRAYELEPTNPSIVHGLGVMCRHMGNIDAATDWFAQALQLNPTSALTLRMHGTDYRYSNGDEAFSRLIATAAHATKYPIEDQVQLHYAFGKAYEDIDDLDTAFANYATAGKLQNQITRYSDDNYKTLLEALGRQLRPETIAQGRIDGHASAKPIFVLGMPRSGTSLIEQVLASHPQICGVGEVPFLATALVDLEVDGVKIELDGVTVPSRDKNKGKTRSLYERGAHYVDKIERLAGGKFERIVDKMPANVRLAGLIPLILPNAHIIHSRRHPVETCVSCYRIYFTEGHHFSYDLADIGRAYRVYHESIQFWKKMLPPGKILEVRYEDMVGDTESQARRLIDHVGLQWDDACLRFYENDRPVGTASAAQVRKPIYQSSVNRWRKYESYLGPLLEELGSLVGEYEAELAETRNK
jgi:tetratricopeptide (TPR) repeat protein